MKKTFRIIMVASWPVFIEQAKALEHSLYELGADSVVIQDDADIKDEHFYGNIVIKALRQWLPNFRGGMKILFQTEELWNRRQWGRYDLSAHYDRVLEMYDENVRIKFGTNNVVYCPVGYSPVWESNLPEVEEDIDVFFHGSLTPRREEFERHLRKLGLKTLFTSKSYGLERDKLIMRSKIDINIKAHDKWSYGPMHCLPAQANKKFMLAEKANGGYGPFKPGLHVAEYNGLKDCKEKVLYWLKHEEERKEFARRAYEDMKANCDFTEILRKALGEQKGMPRIM